MSKPWKKLRVTTRFSPGPPSLFSLHPAPAAVQCKNSKLIKSSSSAVASPLHSLDLPRNTRALPFLAHAEAKHATGRHQGSSLALILAVLVLLFSRGPPRSRDPPAT
ncbi:hypothetical protein SEVIR_1G284050v4 [Setaria viridis]|uniref:Uncharacterized protein n=1 Tax=Setaria viridis TaxID=4556 RepID=A0A4U6WI49_SETVI|nr:hypothetical protein SEVIR_1G284050v2 [Setaria viridis]